MSRWDRCLVLGGIGKGLIFALAGNETLGREESRPAALSPARDYCKGHITAHYLARLSGCATHLLGAVGDDPDGHTLLGEIKAAGILPQAIRVFPGAPTMLSVCYVYPDGDGGNITASNSACARLDEAYIADSLRALRPDARTLALAEPEVPLPCRLTFLGRCREAGAATAATFTSEELHEISPAEWFPLIDHLAINAHEAATLAHLPDDTPPETLAAECYRMLSACQPDCRLIVTAGGHGAILAEAGQLHHIPTRKATVVSTAGAGDAFFSGYLTAYTQGAPALESAHAGAALASLAVSCADTINHAVDMDAFQSARAQR